MSVLPCNSSNDHDALAALPGMVGPVPVPEGSPAGLDMQPDPPSSEDMKEAQRGSWLDEKVGAIQYGDDEEEETPPTPMQEFVRGTRFTIATTLLICINGIIIGFETDYGDGSAAWQAVEIIFLGLYCIELAVRLYAEGLVSLKNDHWVRFDATVLFVAIADMVIITPVMEANGGGGGEAKQVAMVLRILRLMKLARIVRLLRFFKELWLLVASIGSAMKTLFWTFVLLIVVLYVFAILFVKMIGNETENEDLQLWFGTIGNGMFTLFQVMTLESWGEIARAIWAEPDRQFMLFVILFFIAVCSFAIMNTVMAVIVEHTLGEAVDQKSDIIKKAEEELQKQTEALLEIFLVADTDGGGTLNKSEFTKAINNSETRKLLQKMDLGDDIGSLDTEEIAMLFDTIDVDRNTELCPQEFVNGMMQMRGGARARRVFELQCSVLKLGKQNHNQISQIHNGVRRLSGRSPVEPTSPQLEEALTPNSIPTPVKIVKSSNPQSALTSQTALTQLEEKIEASLAKQKAAVLDLEGKLDLGLGEVNKQLNALLHALPQPAA